MLNKDKILKKAKEKGKIKTNDFVIEFNVTRQYASRLISRLVAEGKLLKIGNTINSFYILPESKDKYSEEINNVRYVKKLKNINLEEHKVLDDIEKKFIPFKKLPENIKSIFTYAFSEMLNNAIEHSLSKKISIEVFLDKDNLSFVVEDFGIGVYRNIMKKRGLNSELEALQELLKGKITTAPKLHSGEGIFFTSKVGDRFILDSYSNKLIVDNEIDDLFVKKTKGIKRGTKVIFNLNIRDTHHLDDIFRKYTNQAKGSDYGFDKTEIHIKLYISGGVHISRSQARRILTGLDKFKIIIMDYDKVPMIGQAFADEIYRVFKNKFPNIEIRDENMNEAVEFMIQRAKTESKK